MTTDEERRSDHELRKMMNELEGNASFGIITTLGYRELKNKFDAHIDKTYHLAKLVLVGMLVQLAVIVYVFYTDYHGRNIALSSARQGCDRDVLDRNAEAHGWRIAEAARRKHGENKIADDYAALATGLEDRGAINCEKKYPHASILP